MKLSICMMIKNEEKYLDDCLSSLDKLREHIESELIIVDTGSTDRSVEIAQKYTDKVYFHPWNDDFSQMRNITMSYAKGDWIFIIDGDEVLEDASSIIKFFESGNEHKVESIALTVRNFSNENNLDRYAELPSVRFVKFIKKDIEFKGSVHNQLNFKHPIYHVDTILLHYGYVKNDSELMERKFKRTSAILMRELEKDPENVYYNYQLGVSYAMYNDHESAYQYILKAYNLVSKLKKSWIDNRYILLYRPKMEFSNGNFKDIFEYKDVLLEFANEYLDTHYYLGIAYGKNNDFENGILHLKEYLQLSNMGNKLKSLKDTSCLSYTAIDKPLAYRGLALYYSELDQFEESLKFGMSAEELINDGGLYESIVDLAFKANKVERLNQLLVLSWNLGENKFTDLIKMIEKKSNQMPRVDLATALSKGTFAYNYLNDIRRCKEVKNFHKIYFCEFEFEKRHICFSEFFYYGLESEAIIKLLAKQNNVYIETIIEYYSNKFSSFAAKVLKTVMPMQNNETDICELKIKLYTKIIEKKLLSGDTLYNLKKELLQCICNRINSIYNVTFIQKGDFSMISDEMEQLQLEIVRALNNKYKSRIQFMEDVKAIKDRDRFFDISDVLADNIESYKDANDLNKMLVKAIGNDEKIVIEKILSEMYEKNCMTEMGIIAESMGFIEQKLYDEAIVNLMKGAKIFSSSPYIYMNISEIFDLIGQKELASIANYFSKVVDPNVNTSNIQINLIIEKAIERPIVEYSDIPTILENFIETYMKNKEFLS